VVALVAHAQCLLSSASCVEQQHLTPDLRLRVTCCRQTRDDRERYLLTLHPALLRQHVRDDHELRHAHVTRVAYAAIRIEQGRNKELRQHHLGLARVDVADLEPSPAIT